MQVPELHRQVASIHSGIGWLANMQCASSALMPGGHHAVQTLTEFMSQVLDAACRTPELQVASIHSGVGWHAREDATPAMLCLLRSGNFKIVWQAVSPTLCAQSSAAMHAQLLSCCAY